MNKSPKSGWRRFILIVLGIFLAFALMRVYFRLTDDFRISNIIYEMPYHPEWEIAPLSAKDQDHVDAILRQSFTYLGKGAQSYVFSSEDDKYVLKFFKFKHLKPSLFVDMLPNIPPFAAHKTKESARKTRKLNGVFAGYRLAYDVDRDESGLLFIQLNPSHVNKPVTLIDKIGLTRPVDLGTVAYILQEKGKTLRTVFTELMDKGDLSTVKERIGQIFDLYLSEYRKGIYDHDHGVMHNTGFVEDRPIHLDVGKLSRDKNIEKPDVYQEDLLKVALKMKAWFIAYYPKQAPELIQDMEAKLSVIFDRPFKFS